MSKPTPAETRDALAIATLDHHAAVRHIDDLCDADAPRSAVLAARRRVWQTATALHGAAVKAERALGVLDQRAANARVKAAHDADDWEPLARWALASPACTGTVAA